MNDDPLLILIPAYNEEKNIKKVIEGASQFGDILVVDDNSADDTARLARETGKALVISCPERLGKAGAVNYGIRHALQNFNFDRLIFMDADGQHLPADIPKFIQASKDTRHDIICGVRDTSQMPFSRLIANLVIDKIVAFLTGKHYPDTQNGFRLFSRKAAEEVSITKPGYALENEMLLEAIHKGLSIGHVPVETVYFRTKFDSVKDAKRLGVVLAVLWHTLTLGISHRLSRMAPWSKLHPKISRIFVFILLVILLFFQSRYGINIFSITQRNSYGAELKNTLEWLRANSDKDAIILAHWFHGHQIVAFADRRVVSTTKTYPSETPEVAQRYRDIASFFFAENEADALAITKKYQASFVLLHKNFEAWMCKAINRCELVTDGKTLAPFAKQQILAGKMIQGEPLEHFQKVWDSPRFVIYKIEDKKQEFSALEKKAALYIARKTLESLLYRQKRLSLDDFKSFLESKNLSSVFSEKHDVDVTVWNGQKFRTSRLGVGKTLLENLIDASIASANEDRFSPLQREELESARIEVVILKNDSLELDPSLLTATKIYPNKGYAIKNGNLKYFFLPEVFNMNSYTDLNQLFSRLCAKGKLSDECFRGPLWRPTIFSVQDFIESIDKRSVLTFSGPILVEEQNFSPELLSLRLKLAADWLLKNQDPSGRFIFKLDAHSGLENDTLDWARNSLAAQSLLRYFQINGMDNYFLAASKNLEYLRSQIKFLQNQFPETPVPTALLNFLILADIELYQITGSEKFLTDARSLGQDLLVLKKEDGTFTPEFTYKSGSTKYGHSDEIIDFQAFTALAKLNRITYDEGQIRQLRLLADIYRNKFRSERILGEKNMQIARKAWLVNGFAALYLATSEKDYASFALEVADWMIQYQLLGEPYIRGAFASSPKETFVYTRGTAKDVEAIADAYFLAEKLGDDYRKNKYASSFTEAATWLFLMQITRENSFWINRSILPKATGGFRHDVLGQELWSDSVSHFLLAGSDFLEFSQK